MGRSYGVSGSPRRQPGRQAEACRRAALGSASRDFALSLRPRDPTRDRASQRASPRRSPLPLPGSGRRAATSPRTSTRAALFEDRGFGIWNNFWYAGRYSFVTYSLLYYPLAALIGIKLLAVASIATAALAFGVVATREWGTDCPLVDPLVRRRLGRGRPLRRLPLRARHGARAPRALGAADGSTRPFALLTVLVLAASPVAFVLLGVVLAGVALARSPRGAELALPLAILAVATTASSSSCSASSRQAAASRSRCRSSPRRASSAASGSSSRGACATAGVLRWMYVVYLVACTAAYLVPSGLGENIARLRYAAIPIAILTLSLRRWRPLPARRRSPSALAVAWNLTPLAGSFVKTSADPRPIRPTGRRRCSSSRSTSRRPTASRRSTPSATGPPPTSRPPGIPIARGWFRQDDFPRNDLLYAELDRAARTSPGCARSASATSSSPTPRSTTARKDEGALIVERALGPRRGVPVGAHDRVRRAVPAAAS